jgi:hypothetical protein
MADISSYRFLPYQPTNPPPPIRRMAARKIHQPHHPPNQSQNFSRQSNFKRFKVGLPHFPPCFLSFFHSLTNLRYLPAVRQKNHPATNSHWNFF